MLLHMFFFILYCCVILIMESIIFTECMLLWAEEKWYCKFFLRFGRRRHDNCTVYHRVVLNTYFISYIVLYSCVLVFVLVFFSCFNKPSRFWFCRRGSRQTFSRRTPAPCLCGLSSRGSWWASALSLCLVQVQKWPRDKTDFHLLAQLGESLTV